MPADVVNELDWTTIDGVDELTRQVGRLRGLDIEVAPIPPQLPRSSVSGMTVVVGKTAHVFYDRELSALNHLQTVLHELAHILHRDVTAGNQATHQRSTFDDTVEQRAEATGMRLLMSLDFGRCRTIDGVTLFRG